MKKVKTPKWLDLIHLQILNKIAKGEGLSNFEITISANVKAFRKLTKHGYIEGLYFIGTNFEKEGSKLTEKGKALLSKFEKPKVSDHQKKVNECLDRFYKQRKAIIGLEKEGR